MIITWKDKTFEITVAPEIGRPADPEKGWHREKPSYWNLECAYGPYSCGFAVPMKMEEGDTLERQASRIVDRFKATGHLGGDWPDQAFWESRAPEIAEMFVLPDDLRPRAPAKKPVSKR